MNQKELRKETIKVDVEINPHISRHVEIRYKGELLSLVQSVEMGVITDERAPMSEGLKTLLEDMKTTPPENKEGTKPGEK